MKGVKMLLAAFVLQTLCISGQTAVAHQATRRELGASSYPVSKGGWKPVVGSIVLPNTSHLSAQPSQAKQKQQSFVGDASPSRQIVARDSSKLTSIAQSYKPQNVNAYQHNSNSYQQNSNAYQQNSNAYQQNPIAYQQNSNAYQQNSNAYQQNSNAYQQNAYNSQKANAYSQQQNPNAPVSAYVNPYAPQSHYKLVQNYPGESVRQPPQQRHNVKMPLPVVLPTSVRFKPNQIQAMMQQLGVTNYAVAPTYPAKGYDVFSKEAYNRAQSQHQQANRPSDSASAGQNFVQQVKTVQQVMASTQRPTTAAVVNTQTQSYKNEPYSPLPPSILGSFGSFGIQSLKGREHFNQTPTRTTFLPQVPTRHTVFNSYSYSPTIKYVDNFQHTTPKLYKNPNHLLYGGYGDLKSTQPAPVKPYKPLDQKQQGSKTYFKPSPTDGFQKPFQIPPNSQYYFDKYRPHDVFSYFTTTPGVSSLQTMSFGNYIQHGKYPYPSVATIQQHNKQIPISPMKFLKNKPITGYNFKDKPLYETTPASVPFRATYEVTEVWPADYTSASPWSSQVQNSFNTINGISSTDASYSSQSSYTEPPRVYTTTTELPEPELLTEYTATEETNKDYENSLKYFTENDGPTRRPTDETINLHSFEPEKHKLENYQYQVTTPSYDVPTTYRSKVRYTPKDPEDEDNDVDLTTHYETLKDNESYLTVAPLPTLPPNKYFKRPQQTYKATSNEVSEEKDKVKKRNKLRRRRPSHSTNTDNLLIKPLSDEHSDEGSNGTIRQRIRVLKKFKPTKPTIVSESTAAVTTTAPPTTTIVTTRKKITSSRFTTPTYDSESQSTVASKDSSSIMKINRQAGLRTTTDYSNESPDYSHKQDEKDTPTSDISVSTSLLNKEKQKKEEKRFSFHVDAKPIDPISYEHLSVEQLQTTQKTVENTTFENELPQNQKKHLRPRTKYDSNRPKFSVKDYRNRLSSTTTTEKSLESSAPKIRFPQRRLPTLFTTSDATTTEGSRKKFIPKDARYKSNLDEVEIDTTTLRQTTTTPEYEETTKKSSRTRNGARLKIKSTAEPFVESSTHAKRGSLRKKVNSNNLDSISEQSQDSIITETQTRETTSERHRSESAIMKIAKQENRAQLEESSLEQSKRVSDLTLAASKDYGKPGMFKTVSPTSRRVPSYFTIATDDPILPIQAFFPQINQKRET